jgi:hypothetical protein
MFVADIGCDFYLTYPAAPARNSDFFGLHFEELIFCINDAGSDARQTRPKSSAINLMNRDSTALRRISTDL